MVKWIVVTAVALAVLAAGATAYLLLKKSETDLIKGQINELAKRCSKAGEEGPITSMGSAQAIVKLFADGCGLELDQPQLSGIFKREEIASRAMLIRNYFKSVAFSTHDLEAAMQTKLTAKAQLTLYLDGTLNDGSKIREARDLEVKLVKADGKWLLSEVKVSNPVRK